MSVIICISSITLVRTSHTINDNNTYCRATSLGACWMSRNELPACCKLVVMLENCGWCAVITSAGWLHSLWRYCKACSTANLLALSCVQRKKTPSKLSSHCSSICSLRYTDTVGWLTKVPFSNRWKIIIIIIIIIKKVGRLTSPFSTKIGYIGDKVWVDI